MRSVAAHQSIYCANSFNVCRWHLAWDVNDALTIDIHTAQRSVAQKWQEHESNDMNGARLNVVKFGAICDKIGWNGRTTLKCVNIILHSPDFCHLLHWNTSYTYSNPLAPTHFTCKLFHLKHACIRLNWTELNETMWHACLYGWEMSLIVGKEHLCVCVCVGLFHHTQ